MRQRISAGVLIERNDSILLVRHQRRGRYDFWVAPGGGCEGLEDLETTAVREVREECGLDIALDRIAYIEDLHNAALRILKVWFTGRIVGGTLYTGSAAASAEHIVDAAFFGRAELAGKVVYPPALLNDYWRDRETGFAAPRYLGLRRMETE